MQADRSLSSLPLPSSWTRHGLQTQREHHCYGEIKASSAMPPPHRRRNLGLYYTFPFIIYPLFFSNTLSNSAKTPSLHEVTVFYLALFQDHALRKNGNDLLCLKSCKASPDARRSILRESTHESRHKWASVCKNHNSVSRRQWLPQITARAFRLSQPETQLGFFLCVSKK